MLNVCLYRNGVHVSASRQYFGLETQQLHEIYEENLYSLNVGPINERFWIDVMEMTDSTDIIRCLCRSFSFTKLFTSFDFVCKKGKGFPYSTPSVGPGADPGVHRQSACR